MDIRSFERLGHDLFSKFKLLLSSIDFTVPILSKLSRFSKFLRPLRLPEILDFESYLKKYLESL